MFSLDKFYNILHNNVISKFRNGNSSYFYPFGTYQKVLTLGKEDSDMTVDYPHLGKIFLHCYFFDQEPYDENSLPILKNSIGRYDYTYSPNRISILANSEKSLVKTNFINSEKLYDWYYFYHGFAALDWYRDFQYIEPTSFNRFDKVFICYNHLISNYRSYRLHLVSNLIEQDLVKHGRVSLFLKDHYGTWEDTVQDPETPLDSRARVKIYKTLKNITEPLIADTATPDGTLSANINFEDLTGALFHVVTETVYFLPKLHLTEKVFKPIVSKRPFFLVATPGSLAYFKSYGFRTFDRWIDESYDQEPDHYIRIEKITAEIARLCAMDSRALEQMYQEMQETLEYNFNHFYTTFKDTIVDEMIDNFEHVLYQINNGRQPGNHSRYHQRFDLSHDYLQEVKTRLKQ
jgi:hypothetical protein